MMKHWKRPYSHRYSNRINNNSQLHKQIIISNNKILTMITTMLEGMGEVEVEVGAFQSIEEFARRGSEKWISLKDLTERLAGVSWWCLKSDFRRLRISIEVKASQLRLEVYEGEVPGKAEKGTTSGSLDGAVVRGRFGRRDESLGTIEKGTAKLRVPERVDATAFELRVNRGGDQWVEIYGSEGAGA